MKEYNLLDESLFDAIVDGKPTALYTLRNKNGLVAQITNYGATIASLFVPDKNGNFADIVHGLESIEDYVKHNAPYMGAVCGRNANRIARGRFFLEGKEYQLPVNNGPNHLHGGVKGFDKVVWQVLKADTERLQLEYRSKEGEEGYPGNIVVKLTFSLTDRNELTLEYEAVSDRATLVNLASHSYFNLAGDGSGKVYQHQLMINADFYTPVDETSIPTGEIRIVAGSPMDFRVSKAIGADLFSDHEQIRYGRGYDHNWVLKKKPGEPGLAARVSEPESGRVMEVYTTQPGLQFYSSNWTENQKGKHGRVYNPHEGFCLETQHFPDAVNKPHFPSTILMPGETYRHKCIHRFLIHSV